MPAWIATRNPGTPRPATPDCQWRLETLGLVAEGVAHDFNNILATISGFAELILESPSAFSKPEAVTEYARHILAAAVTGQSTVRELRGFAGHSGKGPERLDANDVLRQSLAMARGALGAARFQADLLPAAAWLEGNRGLLTNVFINLFMNARDAMPKGGCITVRSFMLDREPGLSDPVMVVSVKDSGIGMAKEVQARIFDRYYTTKGSGGSGLGLPNARETVERMGGWISVESEPGRGTEFRIHFPLLAAPVQKGP